MTYTRELATLARAERQAESDLQAANYSADPAARQDAESRLRAARDALLGVVRANVPTDSHAINTAQLDRARCMAVEAEQTNLRS